MLKKIAFVIVICVALYGAIKLAPTVIDFVDSAVSLAK